MTGRVARHARSRCAASLVAAAAALGACASTPEPPPGPTPEELARVTPPSGPVTLAALVAGTPELSTLAAALGQARLAGAFDRPGDSLTLFAPTDAAFSTLPDGLVDRLMEDANRDRLEHLVTSSALDAAATLADLEADLERGGGRWNLANARGTTLTVRREPPGAASADAAPDATDGAAPGDEPPADAAPDVVVELVGSDPARVVRADLPATNGVLHVIDAVLVPLETLRPPRRP